MTPPPIFTCFQWDLVCKNKAKSTISTMVYMAGKLAGALIFGLLSDM